MGVSLPRGDEDEEDVFSQKLRTLYGETSSGSAATATGPGLAASGHDGLVTSSARLWRVVAIKRGYALKRLPLQLFWIDYYFFFPSYVMNLKCIFPITC